MVSRTLCNRPLNPPPNWNYTAFYQRDHNILYEINISCINNACFIQKVRVCKRYFVLGKLQAEFGSEMVPRDHLRKHSGKLFSQMLTL